LGLERDLAELDFVNESFVWLPLLARGELGDLLDLLVAQFVDDGLDVELEEPLEGGNLLGDQAVLGEVGPDDCPGVLLGDLLERVEFGGE
jgi:hypothetical protein